MEDIEQNQFQLVIQTYQADLSRYCKMLAGTPWDGEDLFQETLMKAYNADKLLNEHPAPKAYLFRVATNAWIDHCRKNKMPVDTYENTDRFISFESEAKFEVREAMEALVHRLPPRQIAIVLLVDVFGFTARLAAEMMETTEGAVKALLYRARKTLQKTKEEEVQEKLRLKEKSAAELIDLFLDAFHRFDPSGVIRVYLSLKEHGVEVTRTSDKRKLSFQFQDPDGNVFTVTAEA